MRITVKYIPTEYDIPVTVTGTPESYADMIEAKEVDDYQQDERD